VNKSDTAEEVAGAGVVGAAAAGVSATGAGVADAAASDMDAAGVGAAAAGADREVADAGGAATFSWELPQTYNKDELPALDYERLRADLERYFNDAFFGGCGNSIVFTSGIVLADEPTLLQYAKEACFKLDKYQLAQ
jgi:hypothetical protein